MGTGIAPPYEDETKCRPITWAEWQRGVLALAAAAGAG